MRAARYAEYGDPDVLRVEEVEPPQAAPGQIRIAVRAASVNPVDWKIRAGTSPMSRPELLPRIPGMDAAGVVDQVGADVTGVAVGDAVFGVAVAGATAELAVLEQFAPKPTAMSFAEASGIPSAAETALRALELVGLEAGQTLVVNGAAGGTGLATVQFALARGARVIGTAQPANHAHLTALGASATAYGPGLPERVRALAGAGVVVDRAVDCAGHGALPALVALTGDASSVVTIADFTEDEPDVRRTTGAEGRAWHAFDLAAALFEQGRFSLPVARAFTLAQVADAHRASAAGHVLGKFVVVLD